MNCFQSFPIALHLGIVPMLLISVVLAPFWGYLFFAILSAVVVWVGKLLKGQATFKTARAAYAWSSVPLAGNIPLWLLLVFFYSNILFFGLQDQIIMPKSAMIFFFILDWQIDFCNMGPCNLFADVGGSSAIFYPAGDFQSDFGFFGYWNRSCIDLVCRCIYLFHRIYAICSDGLA